MQMKWDVMMSKGFFRVIRLWPLDTGRHAKTAVYVRQGDNRWVGACVYVRSLDQAQIYDKCRVFYSNYCIFPRAATGCSLDAVVEPIK